MKSKSLSRPSELVLSAIYNLDDANGSSAQDIVDYIAGNYGINTGEIKQKVEAALKRGLSFGLISRDTSGLYKLRDITELPDVNSPQRVRRKRKKLVRSRKEGNVESSDTKFHETNRKKKETITSHEKYKRARLEAGESSKNQGESLDNNFECRSLSSKKKQSSKIKMTL